MKSRVILVREYISDLEPVFGKDEFLEEAKRRDIQIDFTLLNVDF